MPPKKFYDFFTLLVSMFCKVLENLDRERWTEPYASRVVSWDGKYLLFTW